MQETKTMQITKEEMVNATPILTPYFKKLNTHKAIDYFPDVHICCV